MNYYKKFPVALFIAPFIAPFIAVTATICLQACDANKVALDPPSTDKNTSAPTPKSGEKTDPETLTRFWQSLGKRVADSYQGLITLNNAVDNFLAAPREESLLHARAAWQQAVLDYRHLYVLRHFARVQATQFSSLSDYDYRISAWPIQPGALDSWGAYPYSGLVHDIGNELTKENLLRMHGQMDSENATLGLHAIEFMLYGENGTRQFGDFIAHSSIGAEFIKRGFKSLAELPNNRRRLLLRLQSDLLVAEMQRIVKQWNAQTASGWPGRWRAAPAAEKTDASRKAIASGLAQLIFQGEHINWQNSAKPENTNAPAGPGSTANLEAPIVSVHTHLDAVKYNVYAARSLQAITPFLPKETGDKVQAQLADAISLLVTPETAAADWQGFFLALGRTQTTLEPAKLESASSHDD